MTDVVEHYRRRGAWVNAVRVVRRRPPERLRWRTAVAGCTQGAGQLRGYARMRVEEPVREMVLHLEDRTLRTEVVLDARRFGVDLDRGEVLRPRSLFDLSQLAFEAGVSAADIGRYTRLPTDPRAPVDVAAAIVVGRAYEKHHRLRAHRLWLSVPDPDGPFPLSASEERTADQAQAHMNRSHRFRALTEALLAA